MSEQQYLDLLSEVMTVGSKKSVFGHPDLHIRSVFGRQLRFDLSNGFPVYTTKKVFWRGAFEEMLWFLKDRGDLTKLIQKNVHIWDEWGYKVYKSGETQDLPLFLKMDEFVDYLSTSSSPFHIPIHYTNYTGWDGKVDQTKWLIDTIKQTPDRKSFYLTCWNPSTTYAMAEVCGNKSVVLPACHTDFYVNVSDGKLSLRVSIRSNDLFLGNPFNVAQYAMLTHMIAVCTGFPVGELIVWIDDAHIYSNHFEQIEEQLTRDTLPMPRLMVKDRGQKYLQDFEFSDFTLENYQAHSSIKGEVAVVGGF